MARALSWRSATVPVLAAAAVAASCHGSHAARSPLPVLGRIGAFQLTDQENQTFRREDLDGRIWVANFMFTSCPSICRPMTLRMEQVARRWMREDGVGFVSITVDPDRDTPEVLAAYAEELRLTRRHWRFLTGEKEEIRRLSVESFRLAMAGGPDEQGDITHSSRLVLLDRAGQIRGYFDSLDGAAMEQLGEAIGTLLRKEEAEGAAPEEQGSSAGG